MISWRRTYFPAAMSFGMVVFQVNPDAELMLSEANLPPDRPASANLKNFKSAAESAYGAR